MNRTRWKHIIIGSGLSGAAIKFFLDSENTLVLERMSRTGGLSKQEEIFGCKINVAGVGHLRISDINMKLMEGLLQQLGFASILETRDTDSIYSAVWMDGRIIDFPVQLNLYQLPFWLRMRCLFDAVMALFSRKKKAPTNFREWAIRQMGKTIANKVVLPHTYKTYQVDPSLLDPRSIADKVVGPSFWRSVKTIFAKQHGWRSSDSASSAVFYPMKALGPIVQAMLNKSKGEVWTGTRVPDGGIEVEKKQLRIELEDGQTKKLQFDKLYSTIALPGLIDLIWKPPDDIKLAAKYLDFSMMCETVLAFEGESPTKVRKFYVPNPQFSFQRLIFPKNFDRDCCSEGKYVVVAESCYHKGKKSLVTQPLFRKSIIERTINDLERLGIFNANKVLAAKVFFVNPAYIIPDQNCMVNRLKLINYLDDVGILPCGRFAEWKTREIDGSIRRAWELAGCPEVTK